MKSCRRVVGLRDVRHRLYPPNFGAHVEHLESRAVVRMHALLRLVALVLDHIHIYGLHPQHVLHQSGRKAFSQDVFVSQADAHKILSPANDTF